MLSSRPELRSSFEAPGLRAALVGLRHQHASAPFLAANVRSILRNTKEGAQPSSAAASPAIAAGSAHAATDVGSTEGAGASNFVTGTLDNQCLRYERLERKGLGGQVYEDEDIEPRDNERKGLRGKPRDDEAMGVEDSDPFADLMHELRGSTVAAAAEV
jgi:hypothetical protein